MGTILEQKFKEMEKENKRYENMIDMIKDRIERYNDCYEGTPDECIIDIINITKNY